MTGKDDGKLHPIPLRGVTPPEIGTCSRVNAQAQRRHMAINSPLVPAHGAVSSSTKIHPPANPQGHNMTNPADQQCRSMNMAFRLSSQHTGGTISESIQERKHRPTNRTWQNRGGKGTLSMLGKNTLTVSPQNTVLHNVDTPLNARCVFNRGTKPSPAHPRGVDLSSPHLKLNSTTPTSTKPLLAAPFTTTCKQQEASLPPWRRTRAARAPGRTSRSARSL